jgi:hypothetical protein
MQLITQVPEAEGDPPTSLTALLPAVLTALLTALSQVPEAEGDPVRAAEASLARIR